MTIVQGTTQQIQASTVIETLDCSQISASIQESGAISLQLTVNNPDVFHSSDEGKADVLKIVTEILDKAKALETLYAKSGDATEEE